MARPTIEQIEAELKAAVEAKLIYNVRYKALKEAASRNLEDAAQPIRRALFDNVIKPMGDYYTWNKTPIGKAYEANVNYIHEVKGWLRKHASVPEAAELAACIRRFECIADMLAQVKPMIVMGRQPRKLSPEEQAKREEAESRKRTCQICGRQIVELATGIMADHGYQRPGDGMNHGNCRGSWHVPFEESRDALGTFIGGMWATLDNERKYLEANGAGMKEGDVRHVQLRMRYLIEDIKLQTERYMKWKKTQDGPSRESQTIQATSPSESQS